MNTDRFVNIWLGLRDDANTSIIEYLRWDEEADGPYSGPIPERLGAFFAWMADQNNVAKAFKTPTLGGDVWHAWTISISDPEVSLPRIKEEFDWVLATYGPQTQAIGAWLWTGEMTGTEHAYTTTNEPVTYSVLNPDYQPDPLEPNFDDRYVLRVTENQDVTRITGYTGTPDYPIPMTALLEFMPLDELGNPATEVTDRNLLMGQSPRSFYA